MFRSILFVTLATSLTLVACKETRQVDTKASSDAPEPLVKSAGKKYSVVVPEAATETPHFEVKPASGFKINLEYPWKVEFKSASKGELSKTIVKKDDGIALDESRARIDVPFKAAPGAVEVEAVASFSVCNENVCKNYRDEPIMLSLNATASDTK